VLLSNSSFRQTIPHSSANLSFVVSRLNYGVCSCRLADLLNLMFTPLQRMQKAAACLIRSPLIFHPQTPPPIHCSVQFKQFTRMYSMHAQESSFLLANVIQGTAVNRRWPDFALETPSNTRYSESSKRTLRLALVDQSQSGSVLPS